MVSYRLAKRSNIYKNRESMYLTYNRNLVVACQIIELSILSCSHFKFSFTFACLPIGKQAVTLLRHAIYSTNSILLDAFLTITI
ncbi:MAG: hypothetical protein LBC74_09000 [Planctomycetaceae bacterium]|nr:hypothetical protein [Planctomycetaceae bacterium]